MTNTEWFLLSITIIQTFMISILFSMNVKRSRLLVKSIATTEDAIETLFRVAVKTGALSELDLKELKSKYPAAWQ